MSSWKNRIVSNGFEDPEQLLANPQNFRRHPKWQQDALSGVLEEIGWIQDVIVNTTTGHMIDGHLRVELAMRKGEKVPVKYVELTPQEEKIALASIDPISALAVQDNDQLNALLDSIDPVTNNDLQNFLESLAQEEEDEAGDAERAASEAKEGLLERFMMPPFSILDARRKEWMDRKALWLQLGIQSEIGRGNDDDKTQGGLTYALSSQPPHVYKLKEQAEAEQGRKLSWPEFAELHPEAISLSGTSIFDPVLTELSYAWFCPPGGKIVDPFAGGSVRGIVAGFLGYEYTGIELRPEQVRANQAQATHLLGGESDQDKKAGEFPPPTLGPDEVTPILFYDGIYVKRDDWFNVNGVRGGKVRSCYALAQGAKGLVTAGSRSSPQVNIVATIAQELGIPCSIHTPTGELSPEVQAAVEKGAEIHQHKAGYNNVIIARAREDAEQRGWTEIPFGMECQEAVEQTRRQVANIPDEVERIVMPVGSGMSLAGVLWGLKDTGKLIEVLGVSVGADPTDRLDKYAPPDWRDYVTFVKAKEDYHDEAPDPWLGDLKLDPIYEGKAAPYVEKGDLFWVVGIRETAVPKPGINGGQARWINDDSRNIDKHLADGSQDMLFTCPPYADLEVYSDNPLDISTLEYDEFREAYREIIGKACNKLRDNSFAVCVVGEVRDKRGNYYGFVQDTIEAFKAAGLNYYNEIILVTQIGSLAIRVSRQFATSRKIGKTHQNALVFSKGEPELPDIEQLNKAMTAHFNEHRQIYETVKQVLVFSKGDPKQATEEVGDVITADLPSMLPEDTDG